jgi:Tol biopolymer transport system component
VRVAFSFVALFTLSLVGCGGGGSPAPVSPPPPPPPSGVQVALNRMPGSSAQLFSSMIQVGLESGRATDSMPLVVDVLAPGNYVVELGNPTAGCQAAGATQQEVVVTEGSLTPVTFDVSCTFTPESRIVFRKFEMVGAGEFTLWTIRPDGTDLQQLVTHPGLYPSWSNDGTRIAYWAGGQLGGSISIMNWDGSEKTSLSSFNAAHSTWSPDGTQIVFTQCCAGGLADIWMINIDSTGLKQLTTGGNYNRVRWSPDGSMIAYDAEFEIGIIDTNGSPLVLLGPGASPNWSPDGSKIIFRGVPPAPAPPAAQIWQMNIDGSAREQLTEIAPDCGAPSYRSDGVEIVFNCPLDPQATDADIWRMNADGSAARQFAEIPGPGSGDADWFTP